MNRFIKYVLFVILIIILCAFRKITISNTPPDNTFKFGNFIVISSYDDDNLCSGIQIKGMIDTFRKYYILPKRIIYIQFRKKNRTQEERIKIVDEIVERFKNVDYFIVVDDLAFRYFAQKIGNKKLIYFTGINNPVNEYKDFLELFKWCGIEENYNINKLKSYLSRNYIYPSKYVILYDLNTATSQTIVKAWEDFINRNTNIELIPIETISDLQSISLKYNNKKGIIIISVILSLKDNYTENLLPMINTSKIVRTYLNKAFLVGINPVQILYGYDMVITADFYNMGVEVAKMSNKKMCYVKKSKTYILINGKWKNKFIVNGNHDLKIIFENKNSGGY